MNSSKMTLDDRISQILRTLERKDEIVNQDSPGDQDVSKIQDVLDSLVSEVVQKNRMQDLIYQIVPLLSHIQDKFPNLCKGPPTNDDADSLLSISCGSVSRCSEFLLTENNVGLNSNWETVVYAANRSLLAHLVENRVTSLKEKFMLKETLLIVRRLSSGNLNSSKMELNFVWNFYNQAREQQFELRFDNHDDIEQLVDAIDDSLEFETSLIKEGIFSPLAVGLREIFDPYVFIMRQAITRQVCLNSSSGFSDITKASKVIGAAIRFDCVLQESAKSFSKQQKADVAHKKWLINEKFLQNGFANELLRHANTAVVDLLRGDCDFCSVENYVLTPISQVFETLEICHVAKIENFRESLKLTVKLNVLDFLAKAKKQLGSERKSALNSSYLLLNTCFCVQKMFDQLKMTSVDCIDEMTSELINEIKSQSLVLSCVNSNLTYFPLFMQKIWNTLASKLTFSRTETLTKIYICVLSDSLTAFSHKNLSAEDNEIILSCLPHLLCCASERRVTIGKSVSHEISALVSSYNRICGKQGNERKFSEITCSSDLARECKCSAASYEFVTLQEQFSKGLLSTEVFVTTLMKKSDFMFSALLKSPDEINEASLEKQFDVFLRFMCITDNGAQLSKFLSAVIDRHDAWESFSVGRMAEGGQKLWWQDSLEKHFESRLSSQLDQMMVKFGYFEYVIEAVAESELLCELYDYLGVAHDKSVPMTEMRTNIWRSVVSAVSTTESALLNCFNVLEKKLDKNQLVFKSLAAHVIFATCLSYLKRQIFPTDAIVLNLLNVCDEPEYEEFTAKVQKALEGRKCLKAAMSTTEDSQILLVIETLKSENFEKSVSY